MFFLIPTASLLISWGYFQFTSPPMPPFTKEDAVKFATSGKGTAIEHFPKEIGEEIYIVTFTENWSKGTGKGSWTLSYKVDRESLTANGEKGNMPPTMKEINRLIKMSTVFVLIFYC
jgi:hypothetical protein